MKKSILLYTIIAILFACSSKKDISEKKCNQIYRNDFRNIFFDTFITTLDRDTISYTVLKFQCVYSGTYTSKVMFDKYGKWDKIVYAEKNIPLFIWEKVKLFESDNSTFTIITGLRENSEIITNVMVFDEFNNDMLSLNSSYREQLINYFSDAIRSNDETKTDFYEAYWTTINPAHWEYLKKIKREKENTVNQGGDPKLRYLNLKKN